MNQLQFRVLYRQFLLRVVDLELLAPQGDITKLLGQFVALLAIVGLWILLPSVGAAAQPSSLDLGLIGAWVEAHFLVSTTMLAVGLFAVLSWESMFPDRCDVLVLSPLPVRGRTLFLAKVAAVATALWPLDVRLVRRYLTYMRTTVSSKGQIVLPAELRQMDRVEPGQEFDVERLDRGDYRLVRRAAPRNEGVIDWLLTCPQKDFFVPIYSESTDAL